MDAALPRRRRSRREFAPSLVILIRSVVLATAIVLAALALWFIFRRMAGCLTAPLPLPVQLAAILASAGCAALLRLIWRQATADHALFESGVEQLAVLALPLLALVMIAVALSSGAAGWPGVIAVWLILACEEGFCWWWAVWHSRSEVAQQSTRFVSAAATSAAVPTLAPASTATTHRVGELENAAEFTAIPAELPPEVLQHLVRLRTTEGTEEAEGLLRGDFAPQQRTLSLHISFCPSLEHVPRIDVEQVSGPPMTVTTGLLQTYGARFDLRLSRAHAEPQSIVLRFRAWLPEEDSSTEV